MSSSSEMRSRLKLLLGFAVAQVLAFTVALTLYGPWAHDARAMVSVPLATPAPAASMHETPRDADDKAFAGAVAQYREGRWSGAYGRFVQLADQGEAEAARIALFMLRNGERLYDSGWSASDDQIDSWIALAARNPVRQAGESGD
jgi:hypothetical protein